MSLSCSCDYDYDCVPGDWNYIINDHDFVRLSTLKRKRCCSCKDLINIGSLCLIHQRSRYPYDQLESRKKLSQDLEDALCQDPLIPIANHYQCERCGEIFLNLVAAGYQCLSPSEDMEESLKEYHKLSGFKSKTTANQSEP